MHERLRSLPCVEDGGRLGEHQIPIHAVVTEVSKPDPNLAGMIGGDRREYVSPLRVDSTAVRLRGGRAFIEQQEAVVTGKHEAAHARLTQQVPGRAQLLHHIVEHGGTDTCLAGVVDLPVVKRPRAAPGRSSA
jgi:hypothetical protein